MRRKISIFSLTILALACVHLAEAQQTTKVRRIGYLARGSGLGLHDDAFRQGLRDLGYVEGKNLIIELRAADDKEDRLPGLAADLVRLKVEVIVALHPRAARAAKDATKTIPIVFRSSGDPVATGFVASLARPGGNLTGVTSISSELYGKRLELLKEVLPKASRVAVLRRAGTDTVALEELQAAARSLRLQLQSLEVRVPDDFESVFKAATRKGAHGLITLRNPLIVTNRKRIADLAARSKLQAIYDESGFTEAGGLMSYGTNLADVYRRAATYVDKILKGRTPADLPVEQPTKFEFIINLKAAKQIGLTIPPNVLARADKVIK
jgi:putative ABC transport system substrate-binding protein